MADPYRPTSDYREGYNEGYADGFIKGRESMARDLDWIPEHARGADFHAGKKGGNPHRKKRKLSAWNKYVKANSKKPRFKYRNGKLNLKKMAVAFRKTPAGKKKRR